MLGRDRLGREIQLCDVFEWRESGVVHVDSHVLGFGAYHIAHSTLIHQSRACIGPIHQFRILWELWRPCLASDKY